MIEQITPPDAETSPFSDAQELKDTLDSAHQTFGWGNHDLGDGQKYNINEAGFSGNVAHELTDGTKTQTRIIMDSTHPLTRVFRQQERFATKHDKDGGISEGVSYSANSAYYLDPRTGKIMGDLDEGTLPSELEKVNKPVVVQRLRADGRIEISGLTGKYAAKATEILHWRAARMIGDAMAKGNEKIVT